MIACKPCSLLLLACACLKMLPCFENSADHFKWGSFAMFSFKIANCEKLFVHDWKLCCFAHDGETAKASCSFWTCLPCPSRRFCAL